LFGEGKLKRGGNAVFEIFYSANPLNFRPNGLFVPFAKNNIKNAYLQYFPKNALQAQGKMV